MVLPGSFCFRREIPNVIDFMYRALRGYRSFNPKLGSLPYQGAPPAFTVADGSRRSLLSFSDENRNHLASIATNDANTKSIMDLYAGSGCLTEAAVRAAYVKSSYVSLAYVLLVDVKPRPRIATVFSRALARLLPVLRSRKLDLQVITKDGASKEEQELAEALNELIKIMKKHAIDALVPILRFSQTPAMDTAFIRRLAENGLVQILVEPAEHRVQRLVRARATKLYRSSGPIILDPPWRTSRRDRYGKRSDQYFVVRELAKREAYMIYVDYRPAIDEVLQLEELQEKNYGVLAYYRLYSTVYGGLRTSRDAAFIVALHPYISEISVRPPGDEKLRAAWEEHPEWFKKKLVQDRQKRRSSKLHTREVFGFKEKWVEEFRKELPPWDVRAIRR